MRTIAQPYCAPQTPTSYRYPGFRRARVPYSTLVPIRQTSSLRIHGIVICANGTLCCCCWVIPIYFVRAYTLSSVPRQSRISQFTLLTKKACTASSVPMSTKVAPQTREKVDALEPTSILNLPICLFLLSCILQTCLALLCTG